jgi:hypothetical protein
MFLFLFALTSAFAQQQLDAKPEDVARLQKDEVARIFKRGGRTRNGLFWSLVVVKKNMKVFVKGANGPFTTKLDQAQMNSLISSVKATNWTTITAKKRVGVSPSAWDGVDIYLSYREGSKVREWSNARYDYSSYVPVQQELEKIEAIGKGGTTDQR